MDTIIRDNIRDKIKNHWRALEIIREIEIIEDNHQISSEIISKNHHQISSSGIIRYSEITSRDYHQRPSSEISEIISRNYH